MSKTVDVEKFKPGKKLSIPTLGGCKETVHSFARRDAWAIMAAIYANRPLLLRGEPGTGKTQLAQAAAHVLSRNLITTVVQSTTEWQDLLWQLDPVERLSMAHVVRGDDQAAMKALSPKDFLTPGPLWYGLDWNSATNHRCQYPSWVPPTAPKKWQPKQGMVILIDEIDKAELELANALLEIFGQGRFRVPYLSEPICANGHHPPPLVMITTNEERELPAAFIRRCLVLPLGLPQDKAALVQYLSERGQLHFPQLPKTIRIQAAEQLAADRQEAKETGQPKPGQAEYLDLLRVLAQLQETGQDPATWLQRVAPYTFQKGPEPKAMAAGALDEHD